MVVGCFDCDCGLVSVIIAAYNVEAYINECIESLLNQTYKNIEIIVCDDCSTDSTLERLEQYKGIPFVKVVSNEVNRKQAFCRNRCLGLSKGNFILVQDADDISMPDRIEKLLIEFEDDVDFIGSDCYCFNEKGIFDSIHCITQYPSKSDLLKGLPFVHASLMFKKRCLLEIGGYRVSDVSSRAEDYDLIMRLYAKGFKGKNVAMQLYGYRVNAETLSRRTFASRIWECIIRYEGFKKNGLLTPLGWMYVFKPIPAYLYQFVKFRCLFKSHF